MSANSPEPCPQPSVVSRRSFSRLALGGAAALAAGALAGTPAAAAAVRKPTPGSGSTAQDYYDYARQLAGEDLVAKAIEASLTAGYQANWNTPAPPPTWIFDNVAVIGAGAVSALAVKTSQGLVLIDALNNSDEAQNLLVPGLAELGLDAADIKYVVVTHGHKDHYGGARYLAETYGARVCMSAADWNLVAQDATAPRNDVTVSDGQQLTLGGTTVELHLTPGHTPGTISAILPVLNAGKKHSLSLWGGTNPPRAVADLQKYVDSAVKFRQAMRRAGCDIEISTHPFCDYGLERLAELRTAAQQAWPCSNTWPAGGCSTPAAPLPALQLLPPRRTSPITNTAADQQPQL
jgi:metallo-beta-lactamase class B